MDTPAAAWLATVSAGDPLLPERRPCVVCGDCREHTLRRTVFAHHVATWLSTLSAFPESPFLSVCRNMLLETPRMQPDVPHGEETVALCAHCSTCTKHPAKACHPLAELEFFLHTLHPAAPSAKAFDRRLLLRLAAVLQAPNLYRQSFHPRVLACCDELAAAPHRGPATPARLALQHPAARPDHAVVSTCFSELSAASLFTHSAAAAEHTRGIFLHHIIG